jgi:hypothetical protein
MKKHIFFILTFLVLTTKILSQSIESVSQQLKNTIVFPVEVFGKNGATESVYFNLNAPTNYVTGLKLKIHGLTYTNKASIKINNSRWYDLNNSNVLFLNPIESAFQGMGTTYFTGPFSTFHLFVSIPHTNFYTTNTLYFKFNDFNGLTIGYRVLDIDIVTTNYTALTLHTKKSQDDPSKWKPFSTNPTRINNGSNKWFNATITHNGVPIVAKCNDCHVDEGYDLKYFNYSNKSIVLRSTALHSLSLQDAQDIASFIRTRNVTYEPTARPWNPPYQPGPGLDSKPVRSWAAGAGLDWVLWDDFDMLTNIFPNLSNNSTFVNYGTNGVVAYNPLLTLNPREIPSVYPYPDWNRWLPHIHPLDAFPDKFPTRESFYNVPNYYLFDKLKAMTNKTTQGYGIIDTAFFRLGEWYGPIIQSTYPTNWNNINRDVLWGSKEYQEYRLKTVSVLKTFNVKYFEVMHEFQLEELGTGYWSAKRRWSFFANRIFFTAPHVTGISLWAWQIPGTPPYQQWTTESASWYLLAMTLNDANRNAIDQIPLDQGYMTAFPPGGLTPNAYRANPPVTDTGIPGLGWNLTFTNRPLALTSFLFIKSMEFTEKGATNIPTVYFPQDGIMGYFPFNVGNPLRFIVSYYFWGDPVFAAYRPKWELLVKTLYSQFCDSVSRFTPAQYGVTRDPIWLYDYLVVMENDLKDIMRNAPNWVGYTNYNFTTTINKIKTTRNTMWPDKP